MREGFTLKPSIGRVVHYVSHGTPIGPDGSQAFPGTCRVAVITEVDLGVPNSLGGERVGLAVINPTGLFFRPLTDGGAKYDGGGETPGDPDCPMATRHGDPHRYCPCGWIEAGYRGGTWHWPERVEE